VHHYRIAETAHLEVERTKTVQMRRGGGRLLGDVDNARWPPTWGPEPPWFDDELAELAAAFYEIGDEVREEAQWTWQNTRGDFR
jgi:hypothetical protein